MARRVRRKGETAERGTVERCLACEAVGVATLERWFAYEDVVSRKYFMEGRIESAPHSRRLPPLLT
jgi:hypothetical protein